MSEQIPTIPNNKETVEKAPNVEHLFFSNNRDVLIKTSFPRGGAHAICYILIQEPISEKGVKNFNEGLAAASESSKPVMREVFDMMNGPLVFKGFNEVQKWFDMDKHTREPSDRKRIADFLGVTDQDD